MFREYKVFFSFSYVVEYFVHKGNNHIPKREQLSCLAFVVLPCYLPNRHLCGGIFKHTHSTCWAVHKRELCRQRCREEMLLCSTASTTAVGTHPCAQTIIVNDKVTIEVIIVLN